MFKTKLKKSDTVIVIAGKYKNVKGELLKIIPEKNRAIVKDVALVKRHKKATDSNQKSEIITKEASVNLSNLSYLDKKTDKAVKLGYKIVEGKKQRINKKTQEVI
jgi:large subunit ribosomal protein L24